MHWNMLFKGSLKKTKVFPPCKSLIAIVKVGPYLLEALVPTLLETIKVVKD